MSLRHAIPVLFVADVVAAAAFYRDVLGFTIDFVHGDPPFYGAVSRDEARLHLKFVHQRPLTPAAADREGFIVAFVEVSDVHALFAEFSGKNATFTQRLQQQPWGFTDFIVCDCDGNAICFATRSEPLNP